jgi:general secretion pathway protein C
MNVFLIRLQKNPFYSLLPIIFLLSYSLAYIVRVGIIQLLPIETSDLATSKSTTHRNSKTQSSYLSPKPVSSYEDTVLGNMIRGAMAAPEAGDPNLSGSAISITEEVQGAEEFLVTGTISGSPSFARMTAKEKDKEEAEEYGIGQKVVGYRVKEISQHHVVLYKDGVHVRVEVGETIGEAKKRIVERAPETQSNYTEGNCPLIKKMVSKTDFERTLKNPADIYKDARFGPNLVDGKIDGYKIYQIPSTHIFYALGARNSDVIRRVNGMPMNETEKMMELWTNIKNSTKIMIDIDRKGKCLTYEFTVRN